MMIVDLLLFLLPKFFAGVYLGGVLGIYYRMRQRNCVYPWIYFALGIGGYNFLSYLTWGWLRQFQIGMAWLCGLCMVVAFLIQMVQDRKEQKQREARQQATLDTIAQIDAFQARWVRDEVTDEEYRAFMQRIREQRTQYLQQESMIKH